MIQKSTTGHLICKTRFYFGSTFTFVKNQFCKNFSKKNTSFLFFPLIQSEDIRLEPELYEPCKSDISRLCPNVAFGNAQVGNAECCVRIEALYCSFLLFASTLYRSRLHSSWPSAPTQMIECLKEQKKQLSQRCHQRIFRLQEVEMSDPELDYQLMRVCKQMIKVMEAGKRERRSWGKALGLNSVIVVLCL